MASQRRRRASPLKKTTVRPERKRRPRKIRKKETPPKQKPQKKKKERIQIQWKDILIKGVTVLVILVDLVLITFIIRNCSTQKPVDRSPIKTEQQVPGKKQQEVEEPQLPLQIEVLNGCGVSGLASKFTDFLRSKGFDVVKSDNYQEFDKNFFHVPKTIVIDRRGKRKQVTKIAEALGLEKKRIIQEINELYLIDATVILGKDFRDLSSWKELEKNAIQ